MDAMNRRQAVPDAQQALTTRQGTDGVRETPSAALPRIETPKGGGAIRGIGEKFAANPVTGTGSMSVPIATSPSRAGFGPQLALSYDSGAGNGSFGFGWSLSLPAITRKTDKGLPKYQDQEESDVFMLSGAEDLVPVLTSDGTIDETPRAGYMVRRYRPRLEGLFARIERWTSQTDPADVFWRSISTDNITTFYGKSAESRIFDPDNAQRIFSWLICHSYDDKGNAIVYAYTQENEQGIDRTQANERNRTRTANRYIKRIQYGNRAPNRDAAWNATDPSLLPDSAWMFEAVFDYGEGHYQPLAADADGQVFVIAQLTPSPGTPWAVREDPFSNYRSGFEVRTYRRCRRVLMFHHFAAELGIDDCLVRSTEFHYSESAMASFLTEVVQSGYGRQPAPSQPARYLKKSLPPLQFAYSQVPTPEQLAAQPILEVAGASLENLPYGLDGAQYQWVDLDGDGMAGILTEQADGWFYKRNLSPTNTVGPHGAKRIEPRFAPVELIASRPTMGLSSGHAQFMDLAGDGQVDVVLMDGPLRGFYERTEDAAGWESFRPFTTWPHLDIHDPNLRFIDLDGDGHSDILITEDNALIWYPSLAEDGFGLSKRVTGFLDEEKGPQLVFADGTESIYLADLSGDGLTDLVRIRNGEVCYWPNLGYGRFGAKVTMDNAPWFDATDLFDQQRIRLADIDGSGVTDIIYLGRNGVQMYYNQSGNGWSAVQRLPNFPPIDNLTSVQVVDLLGNGTACLVWSSPLPDHARRPMRYLALMGQKPHLLIKTVNNLGAETVVHYAPSTQFSLQDKLDGTPWVTRLPFPVHCVERVETYDRVSGNRFVSRYAYHHGYFDGVEREFRGFGMVEQWDTEEFAALSADGAFPASTNIEAASHVPPVLTRTWFHTGAYLDGERIARQFEHEYYREPGLSDAQLSAMRLDDTVLPAGLSAAEEREACRALKGSMLRQEVYACDGSAVANRPYTVAEQNYTIKPLQPYGPNQHAVYFVHPREAITFAYDRVLYDRGTGPQADPRVSHTLTLAVDNYGNVQQAVAIGYGRRFDDPDPLLTASDRQKQRRTLATYTENGYTNPIELPDAYRAPLPCEVRTYELLHLAPAASQPQVTNLFRFGEVVALVAAAGAGQHELPYEDFDANGATGPGPYRRLIEHVRTLYRRDDLTGALPLTHLELLALSFESYRLTLTPGLVTQTYGARVTDAMLASEGRYVHSEGDANWWMPSGRIFYSPGVADTAAQELAVAQQHFFLPRRVQDPFGQVTSVTYDRYDLLLQETRDPLGNLTTVLTQDDQGNLVVGLDYRVLQPWLTTDPNGNRAAVAYDILGMVVGTAIMGKPGEHQGDSLAGFAPDLDDATIAAQLQNPLLDPGALLAQATTRLVYDLFAFQRTASDPQPQPSVVYTLARETHAADLAPGATPRFQHAFGYSDGFGRVIQQKIQAEPGPLVTGGPDVTPRWTGSGWTIFNNKGQPVKQYEPFFSADPPLRVRQDGRRQLDAVLRPGRPRGRHAAPQPQLREGGVRPVAAGHLGCQRYGAAGRSGARPRCR